MCSRLKVLHKRNAVLQLMFLFLAPSTVGDRLTEASSRCFWEWKVDSTGIVVWK